MDISAKEVLHKTKDKYRIGTAWQLSEHVIIDAMETYASLLLDKEKDKLDKLAERISKLEEKNEK